MAAALRPLDSGRQVELRAPLSVLDSRNGCIGSTNLRFGRVVVPALSQLVTEFVLAFWNSFIAWPIPLAQLWKPLRSKENQDNEQDPKRSGPARFESKARRFTTGLNIRLSAPGCKLFPSARADPGKNSPDPTLS